MSTRGARPLVRLLVAALVALPAGCGRAGGADGSSGQSPIASPLAVGAPAPAYRARALSGDSVAIGAGASVVTLVNVWATWCTSCREEFAELERIRAAHESSGLRVLAVSVDRGGDEKIARFAQAQGSRFPVVHDAQSRISGLYGVVGLPTTYLIGRDGAIRWMLTGSFLEAREALERAIRAELGQRPSGSP